MKSLILRDMRSHSRTRNLLIGILCVSLGLYVAHIFAQRHNRHVCKSIVYVHVVRSPHLIFLCITTLLNLVWTPGIHQRQRA